MEHIIYQAINYQQQLLVYHSIGDIDHINKFQALADETALTITKLKTL